LFEGQKKREKRTKKVVPTTGNRKKKSLWGKIRGGKETGTANKKKSSGKKVTEITKNKQEYREREIGRH